MGLVNLDVGPCVKQKASNIDFRLRVFTRINTPIFFGSNKNEVRKEILNYMYKFLYSMGFTLNKKAELAFYQLKDVVQTCYTQ